MWPASFVSTKHKKLTKVPAQITAKYSKYDEIFNHEYNLDFHKPKDLCDKCQLFISEEKCRDKHLLPTTAEINIRDRLSLEETRATRAADTANMDPSTLVISFDLENVFALPKAEVSNFFYKRKLNTYNLTAVVHRTSKAYCCIWPETLSGRSGNDIASASVRFFKSNRLWTSQSSKAHPVVGQLCPSE